MPADLASILASPSRGVEILVSGILARAWLGFSSHPALQDGFCVGGAETGGGRGAARPAFAAHTGASWVVTMMTLLSPSITITHTRAFLFDFAFTL